MTLDAGGIGSEGPTLAALFDGLPERVLCYRQRDRMIHYVNATQAGELGRPPQELIGRRIEDVFGSGETSRVAVHAGHLTPQDPVHSTVTQEGDRWIEWVDRLLPGSDPAVLAVGRDVTEREGAARELAASERRFRLVLDAAPVGMALVDLDGTLRQVNQALCSFLHRSEDELVGMSTLELTQPDDVEADLSYSRGLLDGDPGAEMLAKRYLRPDGTVVWGMLKVSPLTDAAGEPVQMIGQVVDMTEQMQREAELQRAAATERAAADRLRELDELKNTFLSAVSHELRTPLTSVQGFARLLRDHLDELPPERLVSSLDALVRNADRLADLLADLLDVDRIMRGRALPLRSGRVDLEQVVAEVLSTVDLQDREVTRDLTPAEIVADRAKCERVVVNLIANAVRHTPEGTAIDVSVAPTDGGAQLTVADRGPGIPDEAKATVFEAFDLGASDAPHVGGTGIGLALVRGFVELHGGEVWVEDRPGGGAAFQVELPRRPPAGEER